MPQPINIRCMTCKHYITAKPLFKEDQLIGFQFNCRAYDNIPNVIVREKDLHSKVRSNQFGDFIYVRK